MVSANSCSADPAEKVWSTTKQVASTGRARLTAEHAVQEIRLKINLRVAELQKRLKAERAKQQRVDFIASVWNTGVSIPSVDATAEECDHHAATAREQLDTIPEPLFLEETDDELEMDIKAEANAWDTKEEDEDEFSLSESKVVRLLNSITTKHRKATMGQRKPSPQKRKTQSGPRPFQYNMGPNFDLKKVLVDLFPDWSPVSCCCCWCCCCCCCWPSVNPSTELLNHPPYRKRLERTSQHSRRPSRVGWQGRSGLKPSRHLKPPQRRGRWWHHQASAISSFLAKA